MAPVKARDVGKGKSVGLPTQLWPRAWAKKSHKKQENLSIETQNHIGYLDPAYFTGVVFTPVKFQKSL